LSIGVHNEEGERVLLGEVPGVVVDNKDPLKLGRARVRVDGLLEPESPWAFPVGEAGKANEGSHNPPSIGSTVVVSFLGGNPDVPIYKHAWRGSAEGMTALASASVDDAADRIKSFETDRYLITLAEVSGSEEVLIQDKMSGNKISMKPDGTVLGSPSVKLGGDAAAEALVLGDTYRGAEDTLFKAIDTFAKTLGTTCTGVVTLPQAATAINAIGPAGTALSAAVAAFSSTASAYLSQVSRTS
jgi:hypothetical protein